MEVKAANSNETRPIAKLHQLEIAVDYVNEDRENNQGNSAIQKEVKKSCNGNCSLKNDR